MAKQLSQGRRNAILGMIRGQQQSAAPAFFPAPTGGLNRTNSIGELPLTDAYTMENFFAGSQGVGVRPGYKNHVTAIGNSTTTEVRTIAPFTDVSREQPTPRDRMFAFTDQGIYDVTNPGSNPTLMPIYDGLGSGTVLSTGWAIKGTDAGWVRALNFTNAVAQGGKHYLLACCEINGYHVYDPDGGGPGIGRWYKVKEGNSGANIEGIDPTKFAHVCSWKGRLLFTENDSSRCWYLTPGAITGTGASKPVAIDVGSRFNFGGFLKGMYTWTYDGGAGIDDFLVAISSSGDVVVWQGVSPADTSFQIKGVWYVGEVPRGRRIADDYGGDLLIMGSLGLIPVSALVQGGREGEQKYLTYKIQNLVRRFFRSQGNSWGWNLSSLPALGGTALTVPPTDAGFANFADAYSDGGLLNRYNLLYVSNTLQAWSVMSNIPGTDYCEFRGASFFGTYDGRVCYIDGNVDTRQVDLGVYTEDPVSWRLLTAFTPFDSPGSWKSVQLIRPVWLAEQLPTYNVSARYDFDISLPQVIDPPPVLGGALWDLAKWDNAYWGGQYITAQPLIGGSGIGRWVALAVSGRSSVPTNLVGFNVLYTPGGLL